MVLGRRRGDLVRTGIHAELLVPQGRHATVDGDGEAFELRRFVGDHDVQARQFGGEPIGQLARVVAAFTEAGAGRGFGDLAVVMPGGADLSELVVAFRQTEGGGHVGGEREALFEERACALELALVHELHRFLEARACLGLFLDARLREPDRCPESTE